MFAGVSGREASTVEGLAAMASNTVRLPSICHGGAAGKRSSQHKKLATGKVLMRLSSIADHSDDPLSRDWNQERKHIVASNGNLAPFFDGLGTALGSNDDEYRHKRELPD